MLRWQQDWGTKEEYWERKIAAGQPAPEPFFDKPEISENAAHIWIAFHDLGTERQIGMGIGPIPRSKAKEYAADELAIFGEAFDRFWSIIRMLDAEFLKIVNASDDESKPQSDGSKKPKAKSVAPTPRKKP